MAAASPQGDTDDATCTPAEPSHAASQLKKLGTLKILVIEDDEVQQMALEAVFAKANELNEQEVVLEVSFVANGDQARDLLLGRLPGHPQLIPDLLLVDIMLGEAQPDGVELLPILKSWLPQKSAIVMVSARSGPSVVASSIRNGADGYLVKPISVDTAKVVWQYWYKVNFGAGALTDAKTEHDLHRLYSRKSAPSIEQNEEEEEVGACRTQ